MDQETMECFLSFPIVDNEHPFALDYSTIASTQKNDPLLMSKLETHHMQYGAADIGNKETMVVFRKRPEEQARICLPDVLLESTVSFCHQVLGHAGSSRVSETMTAHFYNPKIVSTARKLVNNCEACQLYKAQQILYGQLPPRIVHGAPWSEVAVDLIGLWLVRDQHGFDHAFHALTVIDTITNYCKIYLSLK
jgi:hypothetical protein